MVGSANIEAIIDTVMLVASVKASYMAENCCFAGKGGESGSGFFSKKWTN